MSHWINWFFWEVQHHPRLSAKKYGFTCKDIKILSHYAVNKAVAMHLRKEGKIEGAMIYEKICEDLYNRLSDEAK